MGLKCGIVGMPNVGKSTLFNALSTAKSEAANYPFCTIEPTVGVVDVPDEKLQRIASIFKPQKLTPAATQFVDIAGLVKGASKGEGLGNQFLSHIRETDAIVHLVRCFISEDVVHVAGQVDPKADIEVIQTELLLADLQTVENKLAREQSAAKGGGKEHKVAADFLAQLKAHLDTGKTARQFPVEESCKKLFRELFLLTSKPVLYVANTRGNPEEANLVKQVEEVARAEGALCLSLDCGLEAEIASLPLEERGDYLAGMGLSEPGLNRLVRAAFSMLGLMTYYTAGPKEVRAWTIRQGTKAPQAAGEIHSDFEKGFICAECYSCEDLFRLGTEQKVKEAGLMRQEGKEYLVKPGDVLLFRFNVTK